MILLSKCKWLEAMLGAKNTEWTETKTTAQPQCQTSKAPSEYWCGEDALEPAGWWAAKANCSHAGGPESGLQLFGFVFLVRERLSCWGQHGSELEREAFFLWVWRTIAHPFQWLAEALLLKWMVYVLILEKKTLAYFSHHPCLILTFF